MARQPVRTAAHDPAQVALLLLGLLLSPLVVVVVPLLVVEEEPVPKMALTWPLLTGRPTTPPVAGR